MTSQPDGTELDLREGSRLAHLHEVEKASFEAALAKAATWLEIDGVEGVAQGELRGAPCLLVLTSHPVDEMRSSP